MFFSLGRDAFLEACRAACRAASIPLVREFRNVSARPARIKTHAGRGQGHASAAHAFWMRRQASSSSAFEAA